MFGDEEMELPEGGDDSEESSPLKEAAEAAFPGQTWTPDRLAGLKELIHQCSSKSYDGDDLGMSKKKPDADVVAIFGPGPKKAKK